MTWKWKKWTEIEIDDIRPTLIALALLAYFSVDKVSSKYDPAGESAANIAVIEFPPNDSCSTLVNFEFR